MKREEEREKVKREEEERARAKREEEERKAAEERGGFGGGAGAGGGGGVGWGTPPVPVADHLCVRAVQRPIPGIPGQVMSISVPFQATGWVKGSVLKNIKPLMGDGDGLVVDIRSFPSPDKKRVIFAIKLNAAIAKRLPPTGT